ncbi:histidine decarboxylase [Mucilaginibacter corticis]|uniref:Histidine decarboxylase n=1 Tax=Mucilaginibacter corticis TaxID=2597670 RepID=A0A556M7P8_9SPHI|nr:histidine decarboxylase [Mucilaginibacter corticis]TSJ35938.1 histidine decarboxylase [Mucilaginibacter corticis]
MNTLLEQDQIRLDNYISKVKERAAQFLGYPIAVDFNYDELLPLLRYPLNNVGDPTVESTYDLNSRSLEMEVLAFFADLFRARAGEWWGYVTNGGSEGNLYGLYVARELYPKAMVYYSEATHYSIQKNISLLNMPSIVIRTQENGEIDYEDLCNTIKLNRHLPVIMVANIGTTMTEAKDDIIRIKSIFKENAIAASYIHCDAALTGCYAGFLEPKPPFDFRDGADSIAISGHKFLGSPIPCGAVIVKKIYRDRIGREVPYIGTLDTTISGSRNGHSPVFLWYRIRQLGLDGIKRRIEESLELAAYTITQFQSIGITARRNENAITVVFPQPSQQVILKWQLATDAGRSHILCMPGVKKQHIDLLIADIKTGI